MSNYESDLSEEQLISLIGLKGPCIVNDTVTLKWIHGTDSNGIGFNVQLSLDDVVYLLDHLFVNIFNLMFGSQPIGTYPDTDGKEQLKNWRLINLIINSDEKLKDVAEVIFIETCENFRRDDDEKVVGLFDHYIKSEWVDNPDYVCVESGVDSTIH